MPFNRLNRVFTKNCKECGKEFVNKRHSPRIIYCSKKCRDVANRKKIILKRKMNKELGKCANCGANRENLNYSNCLACRLRSRSYNQRYQTKMVRVITWQCKLCNEVLVSRDDEHHQMDWCACGKSAVDLEKDYCRIVGDINMVSTKRQKEE